MTPPTALSVMRNRAAVAEELRRLLPRMEGFRAAKPIPFGLSAIDRYLPQGGLAGGALHEVVPEEAATPAAFGFVVALLARLSALLTPPPERGRPTVADRRVGVSCTQDDPSLDRLWRSAPPLSGEGKATGRTHQFPGSPSLRASRLRPAAWSWPARAWSRSKSSHSGRDGAPEGNAMGHGGGVTLARACRRRRRHRQARSENQPEAASRRNGLWPAALFAAAGGGPGIERGGDTLAGRHGSRRARPLRPDRAFALAAHA